MDLAFLQERRYQPYGKWRGTAFTHLDAADTIAPLLDRALSTADAAEATSAISRVLVELGHRHNALGLSASVAPRIGHFEVGVNGAVRPYDVINAADFVAATRAAVADPALRNLVQVGSIDQLTHGDDAVMTHTDWPAHLADDYRREILSTSSAL